jgi:hypothetical protein
MSAILYSCIFIILILLDVKTAHSSASIRLGQKSENDRDFRIISPNSNGNFIHGLTSRFDDEDYSPISYIDDNEDVSPLSNIDDDEFNK